MAKQHQYKVTISWRDDSGTNGYAGYSRDHTINVTGKPAIGASSDPAFRGNPAKYNPEELFLASISNCHMLWYLHLCAVNGVIVLHYEDNAEGIMEEQANGSGRFTGVTLYPVVTVSSKEMLHKANELHTEANKFCFIANSLNFPVAHQPEIIAKESE
ncbi:OsmC family protein [Niabella yanshanensis]|uniref:OsmC family protein n=1 Tax=Niabella yanshanensis TaxID=577386 RepID=A0ABZ0W296_9BACT|nr:OsmC family protein [Niabella yanshanensis]WQD37383.1 OsmC family protein [Niabella yanshanensis]